MNKRPFSSKRIRGRFSFSLNPFSAEMHRRAFSISGEPPSAKLLFPSFPFFFLEILFLQIKGDGSFFFSPPQDARAFPP